MTTPILRRAGEGAVEHWDDPRGRLRFTTMIGAVPSESSELTSGTCAVPPGGFLAVHAHLAPEIYAVLAGSARVTVDGTERMLAPGDMLHIPSMARHGIRNDGPDSFEFVFTYAADSLQDPRVAYH